MMVAEASGASVRCVEGRRAVTYDRWGGGYRATRRADPRIAAHVRAALGDARSVVNVGAGTGSYEPADLEVVAIEPSEVMIAQRGPATAPVIRAFAEEIPLADGSQDAAMAFSTIHHWDDAERGVAEMRRVARRRVVVVTFDFDLSAGPWAYEYFPEMREVDTWFEPLDRVAAWMGGADVSTVPVPLDCSDLFIEAAYGRPELLLDPVVRANCSGFARLGDEAELRGVERLRAALDSGEWDRAHGHLREQPQLDGGLKLLVAEL
jgi:SAM-dependent methyltransferase